MSLLDVRNLKKYYGAHKAVDDISFSIEQGTIFGLLGPNGAGKTTLLRMITGIFYPDEGQINFDGRPFQAEEDILRIGYMPEERGLYKKMKIGEQAMYLAQLKGLSKSDALDKVKNWFEKFEMQSWWNKKVEDLSKGMGQKLQFVTTVLHEPKLIILDEPFSGLDPVNANLIKEEIYQLAKRGCTIIFSTHRMEQVEEICDQIILVNKGKKILDGTVQGVKQTYKKHQFTLLSEKGIQLPASSHFSLVEEEGAAAGSAYTIQLTDNSSTNTVLEELIRNQVPIYGFSEILPSLNDIFIRLVEGTHATTRAFQQTAS
ncbi:ABC transporter ATP-binding protein [Flavihumibacter sp. CACIAM 22H1]|uniref:ABC transporter ATP-binding protein n=1 Tax=Flavihumibacter sp. CACIAM 22H1 TaxID=1812911 RepID=UPI0007A7DADE|nr:ABC transporter ATP-binding protein [Flavihumibacter sp. CACIAM 22H1]KYP15847.1 MAG: ABC transporter ATP-binding protein [Flavihumibacter sp. CACIAM 22H1]